jgi:uncharacterized coiled-coil protein SlyX
VPTVEERVAYLEGKVEEHSRGYAEIRDGLQRLDQRLTFLDQKVDRFREELMGANAATNTRIEALDQRLSGRIEALDQKVSKQFIWLVGIQIMVLLAVIGALLGK